MAGHVEPKLKATDTPELPDRKRLVAALYTQVASDYAELGPPLFAHAGRRLVEIAGVAPADRVLDVATGRGAVLFPAAERIGPTGQVIGIDLAEGMVAQTVGAIEKCGLSNPAVRQMDAEALGFAPASFDRVLCSFAVFFFPDLSRALSEMLRVLRPGGRIGFAFSRDTDPRWHWYEARLRELGAFDALPAPPGRMGIRREGELTAAWPPSVSKERRSLSRRWSFTSRTKMLGGNPSGPTARAARSITSAPRLPRCSQASRGKAWSASVHSKACAGYPSATPSFTSLAAGRRRIAIPDEFGDASGLITRLLEEVAEGRPFDLQLLRRKA